MGHQHHRSAFSKFSVMGNDATTLVAGNQRTFQAIFKSSSDQHFCVLIRHQF
jgi:hypothetical protein